MNPPPLDEPAPAQPTWAVLTAAAGCTALLIAVLVLAITGVIRPLWSHPDAPAPDQSAPVAYRPPPPMVVDLRLTVPTIGDQP